MGIVADTNTLVSGLLWHGPPRQLLVAAETGQLDLITSTDLWTELVNVLAREKFSRRFRQRQVDRKQVLTDLKARLTIIACPPLQLPVVISDPDDDAVLACAVAARVDAVVTGDEELLALRFFRRIPILTTAQALDRLRS